MELYSENKLGIFCKLKITLLLLISLSKKIALEHACIRFLCCQSILKERMIFVFRRSSYLHTGIAIARVKELIEIMDNNKF